MLFPDNPALSLLVLVAVAMPLLYAARRPVHGVIGSVCLAVSQGLRLGARWLQSTAVNLRSRNQIVLLAHGREEVAQAIEREFQRVSVLVQRDLQGYPALQRKLLDEITRMEEDYQKCGEVPPPPPEWTRAVEVIAQIKNTGDGLVQKILTDISESLDKIYDKVVNEYRRSYEQRHKILEGFIPFGRSLNDTLSRVDRSINGLQESVSRIDGQMEKYEQIIARSENVSHALTSSASTQFVISLFVLAVAAGGAFVNFWLIARPMSAMVGGGEYLAGGLEASHVAALVIILVEATMGLFLMETLQITHLFPRINNMSDRMRRRMMWAAFTILLILAGVEVALAVMRDQIIAADIALKRGLSGAEMVAAVETAWVARIPVVGQMILGFILPFALAFVSVPLEYFIYSGRTVTGAALVLAIKGLAVVLRLGANLFRHVNRLLTMLYDVTIFLPLFIERLVRSGRDAAGTGRLEVVSRTGGDKPDEFRKVG